ncbi:MAG: 3-dehydroquinate dehydratase [Halobacteriovoraceae bacterium]|nr:3-dehydroquinate dehydratase [Halobacteriovoraceae bacterium]|tara:strand:- start:1225 stop:1680 length:456 start_codon:yes stop_codon:yes gene_type:complete
MVNEKKFLVINGPNLNFLGKREPEIYGSSSLEEIQEYTEKKISSFCKYVNIEWFQSNLEGEIVERIQRASQESLNGLIINPAAYSHTSVAILDALKLIEYKVVEVHLSNTYNRESFRHTRLTAKSSDAIIEGFGKEVYFLGIISQLREEDF